jgi:hypothetical protein
VSVVSPDEVEEINWECVRDGRLVAGRSVAAEQKLQSLHREDDHVRVRRHITRLHGPDDELVAKRAAVWYREFIESRHSLFGDVVAVNQEQHAFYSGVAQQPVGLGSRNRDTAAAGSDG